MLKLVTKVHLAAFSAAETMQPMTLIPPVPQPIHKGLLHPSHDPTPVPQVLRCAEATLVIPLVVFLVSKTPSLKVSHVSLEQVIAPITYHS